MSSGPNRQAGKVSSGAAGAGAAPRTRQEHHFVVACGEAFGPLLTEPRRGATRNQGSAGGRTQASKAPNTPDRPSRASRVPRLDGQAVFFVI